MGKTFSRVAVVGGEGRMGQWFCELLSKYAIDYDIVDVGTERTLAECVSRCEVVVISVPISTTPAIIRECSALLTEDHLLVDLTSVKGGLINEWQNLSCEVMSLHPMFGPSVEDNSGQNLVIVPVREGARSKALRDILVLEKFQLSEYSPEEHDKRTAVTQVATSVTAMLFAALVGRQTQQHGELGPLSTPNYEMLWAVTARILSSDQKLYAEIAGFNASSLAVIETLQEVLAKIHKHLSSNDIEGLQTFYSEVASYHSAKELDRGTMLSRHLVREMSKDEVG